MARRNPNPQFSVRMGRNAWRALAIAARTGHLDREARHAVSVIMSSADNQYRTEHPLRHQNDEELGGQIQHRIEDLQLAVDSLEKGVHIDTVRKLLTTASDMLRQHAQAEKPQPDTTYRVSVSIDRVVVMGGITEEATKSVASFETLEQASAYGALLHSIGVTVAMNDSDQILRYNWRI